jgi:hypothetical protein
MTKRKQTKLLKRSKAIKKAANKKRNNIRYMKKTKLLKVLRYQRALERYKAMTGEKNEEKKD